ncbi:hypothetical protein ACFOUP_00420 [Belliella kenyensis]|uniref:Uncharacterized protein n=2 Tax=Belliella TaxID=232244 RepID=A0ABS9UZG1_9BACT|nr:MULTISPECIES: hypothetical protein [Belliella]MCH7401848.1 hypothetical protein [Belliella kenyensis]MCH7409359.1 hypothetical protein [Belliella filtrata]MDN3604348.1 hypothetical protein [Belliella kenyensis]
MKRLIIITSILGLITTIVPPFLVFTNQIDPSTSKTLMLIGTVVWFISAPLWLNKKEQESV